MLVTNLGFWSKLTFITIILLSIATNAQSNRTAEPFEGISQIKPDLMISTHDIHFSKSEELIMAGDVITVSITVHNVGQAAASDVTGLVYCIDPDTSGVAPIIESYFIPNIEAGDSSTFSFSYTAPSHPEYYTITSKIDPSGLIPESDESNNKAKRILSYGNTLVPPLSVSATSISSVALINSAFRPRTVNLALKISNIGTDTITNTKVQMELLDGLTATSFNISKSFPIIKNDTTVTCSFNIGLKKTAVGFNRYKIILTADNMATKEIERIIFIPDSVAPAAPLGLAGQTTGASSASFTWNAGTETDPNGYLFFFSLDGTNWNTLKSDQGTSPLMIINKTSITISGLPTPNMGGTKYYFMLKAFDTSGNLSEAGETYQLVFNPENLQQILFYGNGEPIRWAVPAVSGEIAGCAFGVNEKNDMGKYEKFDSTGLVSISQVQIYFWKKRIVNTADNFNLVIKSVGTNGAPNDLLYSKTYSFNDIDTNKYGVTNNSFSINPGVVVTGQFFVGVEWAPGIDDQLGIVADAIGLGLGEQRAWEKWNDGSMHSMNLSWNNGTFDTDMWISAQIQSAVDVKKIDNEIPTSFVLYQNYPNPFNPSTTLRFSLPQTSNVKLIVYDVLGREIQRLVDESKSAGKYEVIFNGSALSSGIYFARFTTETFSSTQKMLLIK